MGAETQVSPVSKAKSRIVKRWRCLVIFYLMLYCVSGVAVGASALFFMIFSHESHGLSPKIMLYFLMVPTVAVIASTVFGWTSIKKKSSALIRILSILLGLTVALEISGTFWSFASLQKTQNDILKQVAEKFSKLSLSEENENYWNNLQAKFECCGFNGPMDYRAQKTGVPFSCCGSHTGSGLAGTCTLIWQKGCSDILSSHVVREILVMDLIIILISVLQMPGIFLSWCFANRIAREYD